MSERGAVENEGYTFSEGERRWDVHTADGGGSPEAQKDKTPVRKRKNKGSTPSELEMAEDEEERKQTTSFISFFPFLVGPTDYLKRNSEIVVRAILLTISLAFLAYLIAVIIVESELEDINFWCRGDGILYICTAIVVLCLIYFQILKGFFKKELNDAIVKPIDKAFSTLWDNRYFRWVVYLLLIGAVVAFYAVDIDDEYERLISLLGLAILIGFLFVFSVNPRKVRWRHTIWAVSIQFVMALIVLRWDVGRDVFNCLAQKVTTFLKFTDYGSEFVYGSELVSNGIFAFTAMPVILFFSFCVSLLYYYGAIQWIVIKIGWLVQITVGTTLCESLNAVANVFLGQTEAPLLIRPYLPIMTRSEIHAVMTGGFASVSGSTLAAYISFGANPTVLLSACVMNAPASLGVSKLFYPETRKTRVSEDTVRSVKSEEVNALHAASVGVTNAIPLVANIIGNLIAFIAFIALFNSVFDWSCQLLGQEPCTCSLQAAFGYIFMPVAWIMGVTWDECYSVGQLLGIKTIINEYVAYSRLGEMVEDGELSLRSEYIATFALCGFSNLSSIGIQMGGLSGMAPERKGDLAKVVVRAMIAGCITNFMTACIAGSLLSTSNLSSSNSTDYSNYTTVSCN